MAKLRNLENRSIQTYPGMELHDRDIRSMATLLVQRQGWTYEWHGGGRKPRLFNPEGDWTTLPLTPSSYGSVLSTKNKLKRLGAIFDEIASRRSSFDGESLFSDQTEKPWSEHEWREQQRKAGGWRAVLHGSPEPEKPEYTPLSSYAADVLAKVSRPQVRDDATGNGRWKLADARQMLRDGYSLDHVIERTGWGRMWLADLADRGTGDRPSWETGKRTR